MKKSIQLVLSIAIAAVVAFGQKGPLPFDNSVFDSNFETAKWLAEYDEVAWKTSDVVMAQDKKELARLGTAWFCFKDSKDAWHAVYGKFENSQFELVFHFTMDAKKVVTRSEEKPDSGMLVLYAKALGLGQAKVKERVGANAPAFNQYIRRNSDQTFTVWLFPAFQTNGLAVYGGEGIFTIDSKAEKITKDESYYQPGFRGFPTGNPREIWLNYRELKAPTLGAIFFVWYYREYFTSINIDNAESMSTLIKSGNSHLWVHVVKDKK
ncbi:MAG: hypothetical protein IPN69_23965 [Acidobacteria bacterium]|nr:hypothetical protein [Acidobacteriota bacterium]MBK8813766.1 hypothetical protein [Acidobacteriota bacterium]